MSSLRRRVLNHRDIFVTVAYLVGVFGVVIVVLVVPCDALGAWRRAPGINDLTPTLVGG